MPDFNIPLAGTYNTRAGATNTLSSSSGIVNIGLVGLMIVGSTTVTTVKDQRFVNCFTETVQNAFTNSKTLYLVKRPGFASSLTPQAGSIGNALLIWSGSANKIISAFGATNSSIYDSTTQLATDNGDTTIITGKARSITETVLTTTPTIVIASTNNTAWYYQASGTVTKITDGDFPGNNSLTTVGGFAHLDGFAFIMDSNGKIWNSDLNSVTAWTSTSFVPANSYPDAGIGVVRKDDKIMAFKSQSIQFFYNAGNAAGSPLSRIEPMTLKVGCVSADAICEVSGTIYWCGSSPEAGLGIYSYASGPARISTPEVEFVLILAGAGNISLTSLKFYGRSFVVVLAGAITFVYCIEEKAWHEWSGDSPYWYKCGGIASGSSQVTYAISKTSTAGKVFVINPASLTFQDNGAAFSALVQTSPIRAGNKNIFWEELEVIGDRQTTASPLSISFTDDDYQSYTTLGTVDLSDARPKLGPCGSAYARAWVLTHSANTPMRLQALAGRREIGDT